MQYSELLMLNSPTIFYTLVCDMLFYASVCICGHICPAFPTSLTQFCGIRRVYLLWTFLALEGEAKFYLNSVDKVQLNTPLMLSFAYMKGKHLNYELAQ